jgi:hypothetical protein
MTPYGYPEEYYHCLLDEQPYYLVPTRLYRPDAAQEQLVVNPLCRFSWLEATPDELAARVPFAEYMLPAEWMVWVEDPGSQAIWPYWLGHEFAGYLANLSPGYRVDESLPPHALWVLMQANVVVDPNFSEQRRAEWAQHVWNSARDFERGYVRVEHLIPAFHLGAMRRYYRHHTRRGSFQMGDGQVARRYVSHNDGVARFFQYQLTNAVNDIARASVRPTYSYLVAYESGAELECHTDREQCEYSITMCIDATPEPQDQSPWPICLQVQDGVLAVWQHLGESLLYRGRYLPHYRPQLPDGCTSTSLLFHYVDSDFTGSLS